MVSLVSVISTSDTNCPNWHYYSKQSGDCECGYLLKCSSDRNKVEIANTHCVTPLGQEGDYYIGRCLLLYTTKNGSRYYSKMPQNSSQLEEVMCSPHNRRGFMCGECIDGYGPANVSPMLNCVNCTSGLSRYGITVYLLTQIIPTTLAFVILVIFRLNITSGPLLGYVWFCQLSNLWILQYQMFSINMYTVLHVSRYWNLLTLISQALFQFWTLSFSKHVVPPVCISEQLTIVYIELFELLFATYPIVLALTASILIELHTKNCAIVKNLFKPFNHVFKKTNISFVVTTDAVFHAFASLFLLSNINVIAAMLKLVNIAHINNSTNRDSSKEGPSY